MQEELTTLLEKLITGNNAQGHSAAFPHSFIGHLQNKLKSKKHTREEMIKYILRRAFNFMEEKIMEENGITVKSKEAR